MTTALALSALAATTVPPAPAAAQDASLEANWSGGILFDEPVRDGLRASTSEGREIARQISDVTLGSTLANAVLVDGLMGPLAQNDYEFLWRAQVAHALSLATTWGAGEIVKRLALRARPYERECVESPDREDCQTDDRFYSFYSLHAGVSFQAAAFSCTAHVARHLYQDEATDALACAAAMTLAATTGLLRIVGDKHYASDVLVGAVLGSLAGVLFTLVIVPDREETQGVPLAGPSAVSVPLFSWAGSF